MPSNQNKSAGSEQRHLRVLLKSLHSWSTSLNRLQLTTFLFFCCLTESRLALNSWSSRFYPSSAEITGEHHQSSFTLTSHYQGTVNRDSYNFGPLGHRQQYLLDWGYRHVLELISEILKIQSFWSWASLDQIQYLTVQIKTLATALDQFIQVNPSP